MCRSDALIGLSSTRTSASPEAKGGVGISSSFNTLFGSPVSRKINAFINTSWVFPCLHIETDRGVSCQKDKSRYETGQDNVKLLEKTIYYLSFRRHYLHYGGAVKFSVHL